MFIFERPISAILAGLSVSGLFVLVEALSRSLAY
jgi:hypothetical protein